MKVFAIRHKPTGLLMPHLRGGRGYTVVGLDQFTNGNRLPRLLETRIGAQRALTAWLKGAWEQHTDYGEYGPEGSYSEPPATPPEDRKAEQMEIVEFRLTERKGHHP